MRVLYGLSAAFGLCLLVMGFQNCGLFLSSVEPSEEQIARSVCMVMGNTKCDKKQDFVMPGREGGVLGPNEAVLVDPSQTMVLEVSLNVSDVSYEWYNSTSFASYDEKAGRIRGNRLTRQGRSYSLPECSSDTKASAREMSKNTLHFFHVAAVYAKQSKRQETKFLVACVEKREGTTALSTEDSLSSPQLRRKFCVRGSQSPCNKFTDYQEAGDLVLIHEGETIALKVDVEDREGVLYAWYAHVDPQVDCSSSGAGCKTLPEASSSLDVAFDRGDAQKACEANKVAYFHAVATKAGDPKYKKQAVFRVACF